MTRVMPAVEAVEASPPPAETMAERKRRLDRERQDRCRSREHEREMELDGIRAFVEIALYSDAADALLRRGELADEDFDTKATLKCALEDWVNNLAVYGAAPAERDKRDIDDG